MKWIKLSIKFHSTRIAGIIFPWMESFWGTIKHFIENVNTFKIWVRGKFLDIYVLTYSRICETNGKSVKQVLAPQ